MNTRTVLSPEEAYQYACERARMMGVTPAKFVESVGLSRRSLYDWRDGNKGMGRKAKGLIDRGSVGLSADRQRVLHVLCSPWDGRVSL